MIKLRSLSDTLSALSRYPSYEEYFIKDTISIVNLLDRNSLEILQGLKFNELDVLRQIDMFCRELQGKNNVYDIFNNYKNDHLNRLNEIVVRSSTYNVSNSDINFRNISKIRQNLSNIMSFNGYFAITVTLLSSIATALFASINGVNIDVSISVKICIAVILAIILLSGTVYNMFSNTASLEYKNLVRHINALNDIVDKRIKLIDYIKEIQNALNENETMINYVSVEAVQNEKYREVAEYFAKIKRWHKYEEIRLPENMGTNISVVPGVTTINMLNFSNNMIPWRRAKEIDVVYELYKNKQLREYESLNTPRTLLRSASFS